MKKQLKLAVLTLVALLLPAFSAAQTGTSLTQTTLSATIGSGTSCFQLASVTGISGFGPGINNSVGGTSGGTGNITDVYIDRELMQVVSVNSTAKVVCVLHGQGGSQASPHVANTTVIYGPPGAFFNYNPEGYCGGANTAQLGSSQSNPPSYTPWINQTQSLQWICSGYSTTWVPGFGNPGVSGTPPGPATTVASAATITPTGPIFHVTGATALVTFSTPVGCNTSATVGACSITIIMDSVETWTAAGNISTAGTNTTAGTSVTFTWNGTTSKWVPSRLT